MDHDNIDLTNRLRQHGPDQCKIELEHKQSGKSMYRQEKEPPKDAVGEILIEDRNLDR